MIRSKSTSLMCGIALALPVASASAQLFVDNFNADTSANYSIHSVSDTAPTFGWDYSAVGIPSAPNSGDSSTLGLRTVVNATTGSSQAMTLIPNVSVSGNFTVKFDLWMNYLGPLNGGGLGSTEFFMVGLGISGDNFFGNGTPGDGTWFGATGDGFGNVYRIYADDVLQGGGVYSAGTADGDNAYYLTNFPGGETAPVAQQGGGSPQTGEAIPGSLGFAWREVEISRFGTTVEWYMDGLLIATIENAPTAADTVSIGHWDHSSQATDPTYQFNVIDNLEVIPEPSTYALIAGLGFLGFAAWRRSRKSIA